MAEKIKTKPKPGKVIRIPKALKERIESESIGKETWGQTIQRLIKRDGPHMWTLPSKLVPTKAEARGLAIAEAAESGVELSESEQPIKVSGA